MKIDDLIGKSIVIVGLGREGESSYRFLRSHFPTTRLGLADQQLSEKLPWLASVMNSDALVETHLGPDYLEACSQYDVIFRSPGVSLRSPEIAGATRAGASLTSQTGLFFANCPGLIVGVTGTKGKSTTASLTAKILQAAGKPVHLIGNIGVPPLSVLDSANSQSVFVFELSSYQLDDLTMSPHIAVLLAIYPEHLDYHGNEEEYAAAKAKICRFQLTRDWLVYDDTSPVVRSIASRSAAKKIPLALSCSPTVRCCVDGEYLTIDLDQESLRLPISDVPLLGEFNLANVLAAVTAALLAGADKAAVSRGLHAFRPLEHRLEVVGTFDGITFVNDSISTIPESCIAALGALKPTVTTLVAGGYDRHREFDELSKCILQSRIRTLILLPKTGARILDALEREAANEEALPATFLVNSMKDAVAIAYRETRPGETCLLSPAAASFSLFIDYVDRGCQFKTAVRRLADQATARR